MKKKVAPTLYAMPEQEKQTNPYVLPTHTDANVVHVLPWRYRYPMMSFVNYASCHAPSIYPSPILESTPLLNFLMLFIRSSISVLIDAPHPRSATVESLDHCFDHLHLSFCSSSKNTITLPPPHPNPANYYTPDSLHRPAFHMTSFLPRATRSRSRDLRRRHQIPNVFLEELVVVV